MACVGTALLSLALGLIYHTQFFPPSVCEPTGEIFFSVDNAAEWMTSRGYHLFQEHDPTKPPDPSLHPDCVSLKDLHGYWKQVIGPAYSKNPFFGIKRTEEWVQPTPFATYMQAMIKVLFHPNRMLMQHRRQQNKICVEVHANDLQKPSDLHPMHPPHQVPVCLESGEETGGMALFPHPWAFEFDPTLEPNYRALGGSDYVMADYNVSGSDYVLPLPPPSPPVQPPDTSAPSDTSKPSRTRRRKREQEVDPVNEVEGKRSRTASRCARGED
ncbi:hypothetical protein B0H14DRAFT_2629205 [Mycena olivaceomarginata]|nr:hypothetical protein B0H14DRAFT_2629205 [Mycena olivaceomarginata]